MKALVVVLCSVTIVLAILIKKYKYDLKSAIEFVKSKRTHQTAHKNTFKATSKFLSFTKT